MSIIERARMWWYTASYNFGWPDYVNLLDGWIPRCAMAVPVIGYLILFNDTVAANVSFEKLASESTSFFGISASARLKLIYLGLLFLGLANIVYRWKRPWPMRLADNRIDYIEKGLKHFSIGNYIDLHDKIRHTGRDAYTSDGKYYDREWDDFVEAATGSRPGSKIQAREYQGGHWNEAKSQFEGLLRSILSETFFRESYHTRRGWLILCLFIATIGYGLLGIPSVDLLVKVLLVIFHPLLASSL